MADYDALGRRKILLEFRGVHVLLAAAITDRHLFGAEELRLHGGVDGGHASAENDDAAADGNVALVCGLAQACDEVDGIIDAGQVFAFDTKRINTSKADTEEDGVILRLQV